MNLTVFANSTLYTPMPDEFITLGKGGILEYLQNEYLVDGVWINGLISITAKNLLPFYLKERHRKNFVLLNLGAVECYSHPSKNFLQWCSQYLNYNGADALFSTFVFPKMYSAADSLCKGENSYYQILTAQEFGSIMNSIFRLLEGFSVIVMGMNKPNKVSNEHWMDQANEYEDELIKASQRYNNICYIDCWNNYYQYVVDTTHFTPVGHYFVFQEIQSIIEIERKKYE